MAASSLLQRRGELQTAGKAPTAFRKFSYVGVRKQTLETDFTQNRLEDSDIVRIDEASWVNVLHC